MPGSDFNDSKTLIVDDGETNVRLLEQLSQRKGYLKRKSTTDSRHAVPLFDEFQPDLLLFDLMMPHHDGYAVMKQLRTRIYSGGYFPILAITADVSTPTKHRPLTDGATDFLTRKLPVYLDGSLTRRSWRPS